MQTLTETQELKAARRKAITAGGIGNFVEWFDFALYAQFATIIGFHFFPSNDPTASLLATFAVFAVGFLARPLGGLLFGQYGDRKGRKAALSLAVLLMSGATLAIGLTPSYATIGVAAPALLLVWRILQGLSAGGEYAGASSFVVEYAPVGKRALFASINPVATALGTIGGAMTGLIVTWAVPDDALEAWAWRIPFIVAGPLGIVGLYLRSKVEETPEFSAVLKQTENTGKQHAPVVEAFRTTKGRMLILFGWSALNAVAFYLLTSYMVAYMTQRVGFEQSEALGIYIIGLVAFALACPIAGILIDRYGPPKVAVGSAILLAALVIPAFGLMETATLTSAIIGLSIYGMVVACIATLTPLLMVDLFPVHIRYTASAVSYNLAYAVFGGTAPYFATWIVARTDIGEMPGYYVMSLCVLGVIVATVGMTKMYRGNKVQDPEIAKVMATV
ncbi:Proline/betaine transporter [Corynebacterium faecale]|uniref:MFS transporter n=1 Tax=Corynebacterium faecale TaxID=1758466 RepID=UPI0025B414A6|nr:MFS transporter [Corynebacterium faecale]WJY90922.1 Proline/betaine transporter [Corynebacterium faecale]